jgi:predicted aldo/keto reductase-like oxidoreductase
MHSSWLSFTHHQTINTIEKSGGQPCNTCNKCLHRTQNSEKRANTGVSLSLAEEIKMFQSKQNVLYRVISQGSYNFQKIPFTEVYSHKESNTKFLLHYEK